MYLSGAMNLASSVSKTGGLGLVGFGRQDQAFIEELHASTIHKGIGWGFIIWHLDQVDGKEIIKELVERIPAINAIMFSFGDAKKYADLVHDLDPSIPIISQIQTSTEAVAVAEYSDIIVAQGYEAGGHGSSKALATATLTRAVKSALIENGYGDKIVVSAGGISDGKGLAAALINGADGVLLGTRYLATKESDLPDEIKGMYVDTRSEDMVRNKVYDHLFGLNGFIDGGWDVQSKKNALIDEYSGKERELKIGEKDCEAYMNPYKWIIGGQGIDSVTSLNESAKDITESIAVECYDEFSSYAGYL